MVAFTTAITPSAPGRPAQALLPLKLNAPPPRTGVLLRPDLQALLSDVRLHPVTLVTAPAGYGKTTLLSQWVQELTRTGAPVCWLTLDAAERDPVLFLAYLVGAFRTISPTLGTDAWRILQSASNLGRDWPLVAGSLSSDLQRQLPTAAFLVLDDLHYVTDSVVITQILGYFLRAAPPTLHIVMSSRRMPTFAPLARLRTEGRLLEVTQRDLHLSQGDVSRLLAAQNVTLSEGELALLLNRTEGWALSVQLAARALAGQPAERRGAFVQALGGSQEQLFAYLASEVLGDLPPEMIEFLRLAALPTSFDAALLRDVLQRSDVPYLLSRAQTLGLPLLPLDEHGDRLRFHPLWRELLLRGVDGMMDADTLVAIHRRFGRAQEERNDLDAALEHYAQAGATDDLARALRERAWPLLRSPQRDMVRRWLEHLPLDVREGEADLLHMWGVSQITTDPAVASATIERAVERYRQRGAYARELRALGDLVALLAWQIHPTDLLSICLRVVRAANRVRDTWSDGASRVAVAAMLYSKGRDVAALRVARQALGYPLNTTWRWLLAMIIGSIGAQLGRPAETLVAVDEALQIPQLDLDDRLRQNLLRLRAMALYQQGQGNEAISVALDAYRHLSDYYRGGVAGLSAMEVALLLLLHGRVDEAMTAISQARTAFQDLGDMASLAHLQAIELYGMFVRGQGANACAAVASVHKRLREVPTPTPDLRLWLLLVLVLGESGETQRALTLGLDVLRQMQARGYRLFLAVAQIYCAHLASQLDEPAYADLVQAGWTLLAADGATFLPLLPSATISSVCIAALRVGIAPTTAGAVLRRQLPEQAVDLLQELLGDPEPAVRASAATLIGDFGASSAYAALRGLLKDKEASVRQAADNALSRLVYRPPYTLRVRMLGAFGLWRGDQEVRDRDWRSSKARQLFQLLLTERGRTLPRERILDALWADMDTDAAANNLRVTLNRLSKAIEPDRPDGAPSSYIIQQGDTYSFNAASDHHLDTAGFIDAVAEGQRAERRGQRKAAIVAFRRAIALYQGTYLPDNMYEDWTVVERERLTMLFNDAAIRLGTLLLDEGLAHEVIGLGWRVLENDQAQEDAYRLLMRAHAYLGERSTALRLYARCVSALRSELGVEPLPETVALHNSLKEMR